MRLILSSSVLKNMANQSSNCLNCVQSPYSRISALSCIKSDRVSHAIAVAAIYGSEYTRIVYFQCAPSQARDRNTMAVSRVGFRPLNAAERFSPRHSHCKEKEREREREKAINNPDCCTWRFV